MNPFLEDKLIMRYLDDVYKKTSDNRLIDESVRRDILKRVKDACEITNLSYSDLLQRLDLKPNSLSIEALESFLAELRSIFWLRDFSFMNIEPLQAKKKSVLPDFTARYGDKTCAVEVFCITQSHEQKRDSKFGVYVNFDPQFNGSKFGRDFISVANNKKKQLDALVADMKILLCVVNSSPMVALNTKNDFDKHAKFLYEKLGWGNGYYVGILAGGDSDTIYPKLNP